MPPASLCDCFFDKMAVDLIVNIFNDKPVYKKGASLYVAAAGTDRPHQALEVFLSHLNFAGLW